MTTTPGYTVDAKRKIQCALANLDDAQHKHERGLRANVAGAIVYLRSAEEDLARAAELTQVTAQSVERANLHEHLVVVPVEPTPAMQEAMLKEFYRDKKHFDVAACYKAMIAASPISSDEEWEPGGTLGNDERYVRKSSPESTAKVKEILGQRASPAKDVGEREVAYDGSAKRRVDELNKPLRDGLQALVAAEKICKADTDMPYAQLVTVAKKIRDARSLLAQPLASQMRPQSAVQGWQPLETAPKDGRWILLGREGSGVRPFIGRYGKGAFCWFDERDTIRDPDRWQPLPDAPQPPQGEG